MNIKTLKPQPALSKYIDFYYFIREDNHDFKSAHYSFPHTSNVVSIYHLANGSRGQSVVKIFEDPNREYMTLLQAKRPMPLLVEMEGKIDRISIFFKPLGLNPFVRAPLFEIMASFELSEWGENPLYHQTLKQVFSENALEKRIDILEKFLLRVLVPGEYTFLEKPLILLTDLENNYQIEDICKKADFRIEVLTANLKKLLVSLRWFIGKSPVFEIRLKIDSTISILNG